MTWMMSQVSSFGFNAGRGQHAEHGGPDGAGHSARLGYYIHAEKATIFGNYGTHMVVPQVAELVERRAAGETIPPFAEAMSAVARLHPQPRGAELRRELHAQGQHVQQHGQRR